MTGKRPSMNLVSIYLLPMKGLSGACSPTLCSEVVRVECVCATKCMPFLKARSVAKSCRSIAGKKLFPVYHHMSHVAQACVTTDVGYAVLAVQVAQACVTADIGYICHRFLKPDCRCVLLNAGRLKGTRSTEC